MSNALNTRKEYGIQAMLNIEKLGIRNGDQIGFIGRNEAGKSTLSGVFFGRIACDENVVKRYRPIAEILQTGETEDEPGARLLSQLKLRGSAVKSGGERTRRAIGVALSSRAPLLFADEPITNLDMEGVELLEKMVKGYGRAILTISRNRTLLDQVCSQIWELDWAAVHIFDGNYSDWTSQKERRRDFQELEYQQYQKEKRELERVADALQRKSRKVAKPPKHMGSSEWVLYRGVAAFQQDHIQSNKSSAISRLEHLGKKGRPDELSQVFMRPPDAGRIRAKSTAAIRRPTMSYGNRTVLDNVSLEIEAGKRTLITSNNGVGKSTLIKALTDRTLETFITSEVRAACFPQDLSTLDPGKTMLGNVAEDVAYPQHICRAVLASLYTTKDDMFKPVSVLSGGEKVRTTLIKVLVSGCSFMILDEPTNHMSVYTTENLKRLLESYDGTLLAINHDRTFIGHTRDAICQFEKGNIQKSTAQKTDTQHSGRY